MCLPSFSTSLCCNHILTVIYSLSRKIIIETHLDIIRGYLHINTCRFRYSPIGFRLYASHLQYLTGYTPGSSMNDYLANAFSIFYEEDGLADFKPP